jgi:hypothetical protein
MEKTVRSSFAAIRLVFPLTRGYRTELVRELRTLADASDIAKHPIAHMPVVSDADYLSVLFSLLHSLLLSRLVPSRAATASIAIRLRSTADNFAAVAFPPLVAILTISDLGRLLPSPYRLASQRLSMRVFLPQHEKPTPVK